MIVCVSGDTHGALDRLYGDVAEFEKAIRVRFDALLHVGDFGIWPDAQKIDRATRDHEGAGDFPRWLAEGHRAPVATWFIKGNHEDFDWLESHSGRELPPGLLHLQNGAAVDIGEGPTRIRVAGIGSDEHPGDPCAGRPGNPDRIPLRGRTHGRHDRSPRLRQRGGSTGADPPAR